MTADLAPVMAEHIAAVNAFDDGRHRRHLRRGRLVNDAHREFPGPRPSADGWPRNWSETGSPWRCPRSPTTTATRSCGRYDGDYDKTNLPGELILTNYFSVRDGKIVTLIVIRNTPASY